MTVTIDLSAAEEARLAAAARQSGLTPDMLAKKLVTDSLPDETERPHVSEEARIAAIRAAQGSMAHIDVSVEDLHRERQADKLREETQYTGQTQ